MAQTAGSPELTPRQGSRALPTWNLNNDLEDETLLKAFETYKKKDSSKGNVNSSVHYPSYLLMQLLRD